MKLYVIRHGRTNCNDLKIYNGSLCDEDINDLGIKQACEASEHVKKLDIDLVISSPMKRTLHTLNLLKLSQKVIYDDRLVDRCFGELTLRPVNDEICDSVKSVETQTQVDERVKDFLDEIRNVYNGKNILLVTHGAVTLAISKYFNKRIVKGQKNCEIREYNW